MTSVTSSLTPSMVENSWSTLSILMLVTDAPGIERQERTAERVAERVAEAGLQRLDDEPRAELVDDLFRQGGALCDKHWFFPFRAHPLFDGPELSVRKAWPAT